MVARQEMLEAISNLDDALMEKLLEEQVPTKDEVFATLTKGFRGDQIVPVLLGSADKDLGVRRLLKQLRHEAPEPEDTAARLGIPTEGGEPLAQVWKTLNAQHIGKQSLVRVWRGELTEGMTLSGRPPQLPHPPLRRQAGQGRPGPAPARSWPWAAWTPSRPATCSPPATSRVELDWPEPMQPMTALALKTTKMGDEVKLSGRPAKLLDEDQSYRLDQNAETQERVLWGQGEIHLKVAVDRIKRWGVEVALQHPHHPLPGDHPQAHQAARPLQAPERRPRRLRRRAHRVQAPPAGRGPEVLRHHRRRRHPQELHPRGGRRLHGVLQAGPPGLPAWWTWRRSCTSAPSTRSTPPTWPSRPPPGSPAPRACPSATPCCWSPSWKCTSPCPPSTPPRPRRSSPATGPGQILGYDAKPGWPGWDVVDGYVPQSEMQGLIVELRSQTQGIGSFTWAFHHLQELEGRDADKVVEARKKALAEA